MFCFVFCLFVDVVLYIFPIFCPCFKFFKFMALYFFNYSINLQAVVITVNLKIALESYYWPWVSL